jgi:hypothetical protein
VARRAAIAAFDNPSMTSVATSASAVVNAAGSLGVIAIRISA